MARQAISTDPLRHGVRTPHPGTVLVILLILVVLTLGLYEALAAIMNPQASIVLPLLTQAGG